MLLDEFKDRITREILAVEFKEKSAADGAAEIIQLVDTFSEGFLLPQPISQFARLMIVNSKKSSSSTLVAAFDALEAAR